MSETSGSNLPELGRGQEVPTFLKDDEWFGTDISKCLIDFSTPYKQDRFLFEHCGQEFAPLGDCVIISGQSGHGKSMLTSMLEACVLSGTCENFILTPQERPQRLLHVDTEQSVNDVICLKNRVLSMCGIPLYKPREDYQILTLRESEDATSRWRAVLQAMWEYRPTVCVLDGLLDIVHDFNNNEECAVLIYKCLQLATYYQCVVIAVLHQNPNSVKLVGHLGSAAVRKVADIVQVVKTKYPDGTADFTVSETKARGHADFADFKFAVRENEWGTPYELGTPVKPSKGASNVSIERLEQILRAAAETASQPMYGTEIKELFKSAGIHGNDFLQDCIIRCRNRGFLKDEPRESWQPGQKHPRYFITLNQDAL